MCFQVEDKNISDEKLQELFHIMADEPPSLKVLTVNGAFHQAYVVGHNTILKSCYADTDMYSALVFLLATYYVMHLDYPAIYSQLLGFLQQYVAEEPFTSFKGTNFIRMSQKFAR